MPNDRESRRIAQEVVVEAITTHTVWLHRASSAQVNRMVAEFDELAGELPAKLAERLDNLAPAELAAFSRGRYTTDRLKGLRNLIDKWAESLARAVTTENAKSLEELAGYEAGFARSLVADAVTGAVAAAPAAAAVYESAMQQPVLGQMVEDMFDEVPRRTRSIVYSQIRQGISNGQTNQQIIRALRGTKALKYKDGALNWTRNEIDNLVRTSRGHVSNVAYESTYEALGVEEVVDVATIDFRVTKYCASIDGRRHKVGTAHPRPPYHYRCRTVQAPSFAGNIMGNRPYVRAFKPVGEIPKDKRPDDMIGQVSASTNYPQWFARQPASFQRQWLGPTRYELYKKGGYKIERFSDPLGGELTIAELRARDRETFERLFADAA